MALLTANGIVLRYADYKESDRMLTVYTREYGKLDMSARGCRRPGSRLMNAAQPFVCGEMVYFSNRGRLSLDSCEIRESFYQLRTDVRSFAAGSYLLAAVNAATIGEERNEAVYDLLYYALSFLTYGVADGRDVALACLVKLLDISGYCPALVRCARCGVDVRNEKRLRFSAESGGALCPECSGGEPVTALSLEAVRRMLLLPVGELDRVKLPDRVRAELLPLINKYAEAVFEVRLKPYELLCEA